MRAGGYTVHQSLTAEAAAVLKLSLGLARRRGHAQVTPLHVAYTLLGASPEPSSSPPLVTATPAYGLLLRRACAKSRSHPGGVCAPRYAQPHPAQCRALDLCFNVALNRLPTANAVLGLASSPSTSFAASLLHHPSPTLSNALVAALKRAQANQRRGCVEPQSQPSPPGPQSNSPPPPPPPPQQQPTLTIKVELDQLVSSILDDPSVSRVMREAGFSSAAVKTNLEEESAAMLLGLGNGNHHGSSTPSSSPAPATSVPPQFFLEPYGGFPVHASGTGAMWPAAPFFNPPPEVKSQPPRDTSVEDVRAILEVMTRRHGRRANPVVVGDSVSVAEASVAELMRRMERGDVPDELRGARVLRLHLSHVHVRLMTRPDVDAWAADLRRSVASITGTNGTGAGLIIYVGDMRWAVESNDGARGGQAAPGLFSPAEHLAAELARLLGELRAASRGGRACWLMAAASYGTFMRCQRSSLEVTWDLQPVSVPAGSGLDLELGPRATRSPADGKAAQPARFPLLDLAPKREDTLPMPTLCVECARYYESEASAARANAEGTNLALTFFPGWPQTDLPHTSHKDELMELKSKWSRLCQMVHSQLNQPARPPNATTSSSPGLCLSFEAPSSFHGRSKTKNQDVKTTLSLLVLPESVQTSDEVHRDVSEDMDAMPAAQERDATSKSSDKKSVPWLWTDELPSGDLKRKAESVRITSQSKRWKGNGGLDLNLRADEEDGDSGSTEDELVPSDLTNDGEASGGGTDSLDSHCQADMTFGH